MYIWILIKHVDKVHHAVLESTITAYKKKQKLKHLQLSLDDALICFLLYFIVSLAYIMWGISIL